MKFLLLSLSLILFISSAEAGRIRLRKVKDAPKTCTIMDEDRFLTRSSKRIFGTLRNSVIIEDNVVVVNDLGQKICLWSYDKLLPFGDLSQYKFYIDEYKNTLIPFKKDKKEIFYSKINLNDCEIGEVRAASDFDLPRCEKPSKKSKKSSKSKRKLASRK